MAFCEITKENFDDLLQIVYRDVYDGKFVDVKKSMNDVYNLVFDKDNRDMALTYAGLIPRMLLLVSLNDDNMRVKIQKVISTDDLFDLKSRFADNLDEVNKFLFGPKQLFSPEEVNLLMSRIANATTVVELESILAEPDVKEFLFLPENKKLLENYLSNWTSLKNAYEAELAKNIQKIQGELAGNIEEKKEEEEKKDEDESFAEDEEQFDSDEIVYEEDNIEPSNYLAYLTPIKTVTNELRYDPFSQPDDEMKLSTDDYDHFMTRFYNSNHFIDGAFDLILQNDTDELILQRMIHRDAISKEDALSKKGQVIVFRLKNGELATMGNTNVIRDKENPLYNAPLVTSVNDSSFNKHIVERMFIYSKKFNVSLDEARRHYETQQELLDEARQNLRTGLVKEYIVTPIHQSRGVYELTDEGKVVTRFKNGDKTALIDFQVLTRNTYREGKLFERGQTVARIQGQKSIQSLAVSAPTVSSLTGEFGTLIRDGITAYLFQEYATREQATSLAINFFRKVLYTKKDSINLRVAFNNTTKMYQIIYEKKNKDGKMVPVTIGTIGRERINVNAKLLEQGGLLIPSINGPVAINSDVYNKMLYENISTNRKAVRNKEGDFHLDLLNAYVSLQLPKVLTPPPQDVIAKVEHQIGDNTYTYTVVINPLGMSVIQDTPGNPELPLKDRRDIVTKAKLANGFKVSEPTVVLEKPIEPSEPTPEQQEQTQQQEEIKEETKEEVPSEPISSDTEKIITTKKSEFEIATQDKLIFRVGTIKAPVDLSTEDPFYDAFSKNNRKMTAENVAQLNDLLQMGKTPKELALLVGDDYYIMAKIGGTVYKAFDKSLHVIPMASVSNDDLNKFLEQNNLCK